MIIEFADRRNARLLFDEEGLLERYATSNAIAIDV
jgi:hypothetical protein